MITRENYEEFFMLYADNELTAADKQAVELFVQENVDLADELELYLQTRLPDEPVMFGNKTQLLRSEAEDITANLEEQFLLYVDNELDAVSREKVELFVLQNPAYQSSFTLLKQTKLPDEKIVFPGKASLYRKEEKKRPVIYMRWGRMVAAAAFIGLVVMVWTLLPHDRTSTSSIASTGGRPAIDGHQPSSVAPSAPSPVSVENSGAITASGERVDKSNTITVQPQQTTGVMTNQPVDQQHLVAVNTATPPAEEKGVTIEVTHPETVNTGLVTGSFTDNGSAHAAELARNTDHAADEETTNTIAQPAVYKELDTDDEKKSLYLGSLEINKDKLRGFFRKAGSIFRGKARQEEDNNKTESAPRSRSLK